MSCREVAPATGTATDSGSRATIYPRSLSYIGEVWEAESLRSYVLWTAQSPSGPRLVYISAFYEEEELCHLFEDGYYEAEITQERRKSLDRIYENSLLFESASTPLDVFETLVKQSDGSCDDRDRVTLLMANESGEFLVFYQSHVRSRPPEPYFELEKLFQTVHHEAFEATQEDVFEGTPRFVYE